MTASTEPLRTSNETSRSAGISRSTRLVATEQPANVRAHVLRVDADAVRRGDVRRPRSTVAPARRRSGGVDAFAHCGSPRPGGHRRPSLTARPVRSAPSRAAARPARRPARARRPRHPSRGPASRSIRPFGSRSVTLAHVTSAGSVRLPGHRVELVHDPERSHAASSGSGGPLRRCRAPRRWPMARATNARSDRLRLVDLVVQSRRSTRRPTGSIDARAIARRMNCMTSSTCSSGTGTITYGIAAPSVLPKAGRVHDAFVRISRGPRARSLMASVSADADVRDGSVRKLDVAQSRRQASSVAPGKPGASGLHVRMGPWRGRGSTRPDRGGAPRCLIT